MKNERSFIQKLSSSVLFLFALFMLFLQPVSAFTNYSFAGNTTTSFTRVSPLKTKTTSSTTMPMVCFQSTTDSGKTASFGVYKGGVYYSTISQVPCNSVQYTFSYSVCQYGESYELNAKIDNSILASVYISGIWRP